MGGTSSVLTYLYIASNLLQDWIRGSFDRFGQPLLTSNRIEPSTWTLRRKIVRLQPNVFERSLYVMTP
jgi:hypothetical protein